MMRTTSILVVGALSGALLACKGDTITKIDPQTKTDLDNCNAIVKDQKTLITSLQDENAKLLTKQTAAEVTVKIEGTLFTVSPSKPGQPPPPIDDKATIAASKEFYDVVRKSKGAIQKCYEQALKKTSGLQSKPINLTVFASFANTGAYKTASFTPSLGDTFDGCIRAVATKWVMPTNSPAMTFQATVALTPT